MEADDRSRAKHPWPKPVFTGMVKDAHAAGLKAHPYALRQDEGQIPAYDKDFNDLLNIFLYQDNVDGIFSDFPDKAVQAVKAGNK